jgi:hypothetical protein
MDEDGQHYNCYHDHCIPSSQMLQMHLSIELEHIILLGRCLRVVGTVDPSPSIFHRVHGHASYTLEVILDCSRLMGAQPRCLSFLVTCTITSCTQNQEDIEDAILHFCRCAAGRQNSLKALFWSHPTREMAESAHCTGCDLCSGAPSLSSAIAGELLRVKLKVL